MLYGQLLRGRGAGGWSSRRTSGSATAPKRVVASVAIAPVDDGAAVVGLWTDQSRLADANGRDDAWAQNHCRESQGNEQVVHLCPPFDSQSVFQKRLGSRPLHPLRG